MPLPNDKFIAVNILPSHMKAGKDTIEVLQERIAKAQAMGFTHAWLNPISIVPASFCERICLDTGTPTAQYNSLYAPDEPHQIRPDFPIEKIRAINQSAKANHFFILADFVWKHVSVSSSLLSKNPDWFGKRVKDIVEYNFTDKSGKLTEAGNQIAAYLQKTIRLLLDSQEGYNFAGIRVDAASHLPPVVREILYGFIRKTYPEAIIFEEVLFDRAQEERIRQLAFEAKNLGIYSDFVTTNSYYQSPDAFGALPNPETMGDKTKLELAEGRGVSFTGNHDHFSVGWGTVLQMAWKAFKSDPAFLARIREVKTTPSGAKAERLEEALEVLLNKVDSGPHPSFAENLENPGIIRYLIPYANKIARSLLILSSEASPESDLLEEFQLQLFERIYNRTLTGISGYFFLFSELVSPFETQRIFSNQDGAPLQLLLLTADDLKEDMVLTNNILTQMASVFPNFTNFLKAFPILKKARSPGYICKTDESERLVHDLQLCLPYIIDYLRNHPSENKYKVYKNAHIIKDEEQLALKLELVQLITGINQIYARLTTHGCSHFHTFNSIDKFKIIIRYNQTSTDLIILNLGTRKLTLGDIDLEKIALWFQSRLYPQEAACKMAVILSSPFNDEATINPPNGYMEYWKKAVGSAFDLAYNQIIGAQPGHTTNLYLGPNIANNTTYPLILKLHLKTQVEEEYDIFERALIERKKPDVQGKMAHSTLFHPQGKSADANPTATSVHIASLDSSGFN